MFFPILAIVAFSLSLTFSVQAQANEIFSLPPASSLSDNSSQILLQRVEIIGSTVFSPEEIASITSPYLGKELTIEIIEEIVDQITKLYVDNGYLTSGAYPPPQDLSDGTFKVQVDVGTVWNNKSQLMSPNALASTGLDLSWQIGNFNLRSTYGIPLVKRESGNSLQENGFSFSVGWQQQF